MGNCSSCLGRRGSDAEDDESRMLFEDADGTNYGSFGDAAGRLQDHHHHHHRGSNMDDDDEAQSQREAEALQSVVTRTADNMVDVFEIAPRHAHALVHGAGGAAYTLSMPGYQFQSLLSKLSDTGGDEGEYGDEGGAYGEDGEDGEDGYGAHGRHGAAGDDIEVDVDVVDAGAPAPYHALLSANAAAAGVLVGNFTDAAR